MEKRARAGSKKPRRGRPPKPGGRGDKDAVNVAVRLTKDEAGRLDAARGKLTRSAWLRSRLPPS